ncbi:MAG: CfrBI family restriction endonuclease [Chloroflexia bacterium]
MPDSGSPDELTINDLFPTGSRVLLSGGGKQFIERIGVEAARRVVLSVMMGENVRKETEPLTQQRIAQISGGLVALFARGGLEIDNFTSQISEMAVEQITGPRRNDKASTWVAQWLIGLTGKSVQNVLRSNPEQVQEYIRDFEAAIERAAAKCREDLGDLKMTLGFVEDGMGQRVELDWRDINRLTTAIGTQTLSIRGSEKSLYGKLFEKLILGSFLTILGFQRVNPATNMKTEKIFWLSDSSENRESDATLLIQPGRLVRLDIGFIGRGNPEISKDKLSRYTREMEIAGSSHSSVTFIIVDRLPETSKTRQAAEKIGAEIVQMSMQYWPRDVARRLGQRFGFKHELQTMADDKMPEYLASKLAAIQLQDFLVGVSLESLESNQEPAAEEREWSPEDEE